MTMPDEIKKDLRELQMAANIADTFDGRDCCAALDRVEAFLNTRAQPPSAETINHERLIEWIRNPKRLPAHRSFTDSIERQIAYAIEAMTPSADCVMVPREPTNAQIATAVTFGFSAKLGGEYGWTDYMRDLYQAMLTAAPQNNPATSDAADSSGTNAVLSDDHTPSTQDGPEGTLDRGVECPPIEDCSPCNEGWRFTYGVDSYHFPCPNCSKPDADGVDIEKLKEALAEIDSGLPKGDFSNAVFVLHTLEKAARAYLEMMEKRNEQI